MTITNKAYLYVLLPIVCWSAVPSAVKFALRELTHVQILFYNNVFGAVTLAAIILFLKKQQLFRRYGWRDYVIMALMGAVGLYGYYMCLYASFSLAPIGQANMLNYTWPMFVVIFSIMFNGEAYNRVTIVALLISFIGTAIIFTGGGAAGFDSAHARGYLLALCAAMCTGLFSVLTKKLNYDRLTSMLVYYITSLLLVTPTMLLQSGFQAPRSAAGLGAVFFLGTGATCLGFLFWFKALSSGSASKLANMIYGNPFFALIFLAVFHKEQVPIYAVLGLALNTAGVFLQLTNRIVDPFPSRQRAAKPTVAAVLRRSSQHALRRLVVRPHVRQPLPEPALVG